MTDPNEAQGRAIHVLRVVLGMTQAELAGAIGTGTSSVSDWETGKVIPRERSLKRLLRAVGLPPSALVRTERYIREIEGLLEHNPDAAYAGSLPGSEIAESQRDFLDAFSADPLLQAHVDRLAGGMVGAAAGFAGLVAEALAPLLTEHRGRSGPPADAPPAHNGSGAPADRPSVEADDPV